MLHHSGRTARANGRERSHYRFMYFFALIGMILPWALLPAPATAQGALLKGLVVSSASRQPLTGATLLLDGVTRVTTGPDGRFVFPRVANGSHSLEVSKLGFVAVSRTVAVPSEAANSLEFVLFEAPRDLGVVTVIGSNADLQERRRLLNAIPGGVAMVTPAEIKETRQANLKDVLRFVPGVYVQPRFGAADESQISVRGSGLRNNFHARGINLLVNGMPYRNADGFTDFESLELLTTESIEVYKGGNALAYGGSTLGGAINLSTKTGYSAPSAGLFAQGGSYGFYKAQVESGKELGAFDYYASYARTSLDGYRDWASHERDRLNLHAGYRITPQTDVRGFYFFARVKEQLPGALDAATFAARPESADPNNKANRWGRNYDLHHVGLQMRSQIATAQRIEFSPYMQYRDIDHPIFQVIAQISHDYGAELRYINELPIAGHVNRLIVGVQGAYETMQNRQYVNNVGSHGALTKDQHDRVDNVAVYAENVLDITSALSAVVGARFDHATRKSEDFFLSNGDQSDDRTFSPFTPKVGLTYAVAGGPQLFGNVSRSFEPPLLLELNSLTIPGFVELKGQDAWQYELGMRSTGTALSWEASLYDVELKDEILNINVQPFPNAPFTVPTYRNAPKTRHRGLETAASFQLPGGVFSRGEFQDHIILRGAYTYSRFTFVEDPTYAGNDIPGAPAHVITAEAKYTHPAGFSVAPTVEWIPSSYFVNSQNTKENAAWTSVGARAEWASPRSGLTLFVAGQNLLDRRFSQSVQVDNAAGKFYEPADRRSFYGGIRWSP